MPWSGLKGKHRGTGQFSAHPFAVHNRWMWSNLCLRERECFRLGNNSASIWVLHMKEPMCRVIKFCAELHKKFVESNLDLESLRSMPWLTLLLPWLFPFLPQYLHQLWLPSFEQGERPIQPSVHQGAPIHSHGYSNSQGSRELFSLLPTARRELRATDSWKPQGPLGRYKHPLTIQLPVLDGTDHRCEAHQSKGSLTLQP